MSRLVLNRKEDENVVIHKNGEVICLVKLTELAYHLKQTVTSI